MVFHVEQLRGQFKGSPLKLSGGGARLDDVSLIVRGPELQVGIRALVILTGGCKLGAGYTVFLRLPHSLSDASDAGETSCLIPLHGC